MKSLFNILTLLLIVAFVAGCGISKNEYDSRALPWPILIEQLSVLAVTAAF